MFSGLKKRVSSALQETRHLSESLHTNYIRPAAASTAAHFQSATAATPPPPPVSSTYSSSSSPAATSSSFFPDTSPLSAKLPAAVVSYTAAPGLPFPGDRLNAHAGVSLLVAHESGWQQLHESQLAAAAMADTCDTQIREIRQCSERSAVAVSDMSRSLAAVPAIVGRLVECRLLLEEVGRMVGRVEEALFGLEEVGEELAVQERQLQLSIELAVYREQKMADLERVRSKLVEEHAARQRQHEQRLRTVQLERQAVFQEAFQSDLNVYRTMGTIPKVQLKPAANDSAALEEIVLDTVGDDSRRLDEFLNN